MSADFFLVPTQSDPQRGQQAVREFLAPHMKQGDVHVEWGDDGSSVDIYGLEDDSQLIMLNRPAGDQIWNLVYELMVAGELMFAPSDGDPIMVLHDEIKDATLEMPINSTVVVVSSGDEIREALG